MQAKTQVYIDDFFIIYGNIAKYLLRHKLRDCQLSKIPRTCHYFWGGDGANTYEAT